MDALKRLFARAKMGLGGYVPIGSQRGIVVTPEQEKAFRLFMAHGEALVEALERLLVENEHYIKINNLSAMGNVNLVNARTVLAAINKDAGQS